MVTAVRENRVAERSAASFGRRVLSGVVGGVAGGIVFGVLMAMMGMLVTIASMVGSNAPIIGFAIHIMMSILIGMAPFTFDSTTLPSLMGHLIYGAILGLLATRLIAHRR